MGKICVDVSLPQVPFVRPIKATVVDIKGGNTVVQADFAELNSSNDGYIKNRDLIATKEDIEKLKLAVEDLGDGIDDVAFEKKFNDLVSPIQTQVNSLADDVAFVRKRIVNTRNKLEALEAKVDAISIDGVKNEIEESLDKKLNEISELVNSSNTELYGKLELVEQKSTKVSSKVTELEESVDSTKSALEEQSEILKVLNSDIDSVQKSISKVDELEEKVQKADETILSLSNKVEELDKQIDSEAELDEVKADIQETKLDIEKVQEEMISMKEDCFSKEQAETIIQNSVETIKEIIVQDSVQTIKEEVYTKEQVDAIIEATDTIVGKLTDEEVEDLFYDVVPRPVAFNEEQDDGELSSFV